MHLSLQILRSVSIVVLVAGLAAGADIVTARNAYQEKDFVTAVKESAPLAEQGNPEAQLLLGRMYLMGQGVSKNDDQARKWFEASAVQGNADAQFMLGSMYLLPQKEAAKGLTWLRLSADQGNQDAQFLLGKAYAQGLPGLPRDPVQAELWLSLAAKDNLPFYKTELGNAETQMTADEISRGRALAAGWKPKAGQKPPAGEESPKHAIGKSQQN